MSVMIGCIFIDLGFDQIAVRDRVGLFFIMGGLYPFIVILDTIAKFTAGTRVLLIASAPSTTCFGGGSNSINVCSPPDFGKMFTKSTDKNRQK